MYTVRISHHPAPGKGAELRAALEEHSRASNAAGSPHNVSQQLYASEATFVNAIRHESLAAIEAYGLRNASDPNYTARTARIGACVARPQNSELYENLVSAPVTDDVNYTLRMTYFPAAGKGGELRQALEKRATTPSSGSVGKRLSTQVVPPHGGNYTLTVLFSSLAGFEQYRAAQQGDAAVQAFVAQLTSLLAGPTHQELHRVLVRFPA